VSELSGLGAGDYDITNKTVDTTLNPRKVFLPIAYIHASR
jgi:hypothetical protein